MTSALNRIIAQPRPPLAPIYPPKSIADVRRRRHAEETAFYALIDDMLDGKKLSSSVAHAQLAALTGRIGVPADPVMSNRLVRRAAADLLLRHLTRFWQTTKSTPHRRWWFVSFIGDIGHSLESAPEIYLDAFRQAVDRLLRQADLNAVFALEVQGLSNFPQRGSGGTLMLNAHAFAWSDDPKFDAKSVEKALRQSKRLTSVHKAKTVTVLDIEDDEGDVARPASYLLKVPADGKRLERLAARKWQTRFAKTALPPQLRLRLVEVMSQLEAPEVVRGVGQGSDIAAAWRADFFKWFAAQPRARPSVVANFNVPALWRSLLRLNATRRSLPRRSVRVFRKGPTPTLTMWKAAALARLRDQLPRRSSDRQSNIAKSS